MYDAFLGAQCSHRIVEEVLTINQTLPYPTAILKNKAITKCSTVFIRSWDDQMTLLKNAASYIDVQVPATGVNYAVQPKAGLIRAIGITAFAFLDEQTIQFNPALDTTNTRFIVTNANVVPQPTYLVDYYARPESCPICGGSGVVTDIAINAYGKLVLASGKAKVRQRVVKALLTPEGKQPFNSSFGSILNSYIGSAMLGDSGRIGLTKAINDCILTLIKMQDTTLPQEEQITALSSLSIQLGTDPSVSSVNKDAIFVKVTVRTADGADVPVFLHFLLGATTVGTVSSI